jgi:hypothetical protein
MAASVETLKCFAVSKTPGVYTEDANVLSTVSFSL